MSGGVAALGERSDALLSARDLGRKYEDFLALGSFHLDLAAGEFVALIGPTAPVRRPF